MNNHYLVKDGEYDNYKCLKCGRHLPLECTFKNLRAYFAKGYEYTERKKLFKSSYKKYKDKNGKYYTSRVGNWVKKGKLYLVNPFTGKKLYKSACNYSMTDIMIKEII